MTNRSRSSLVQSSLALALVLSSIGIVIGGIWFSIQLFINPNAVSWTNRFLPQWAQIPLVKSELAQTLTQIQASIKQLGGIPGEPIFLDTVQPRSLLLPVIQQRSDCLNDCQQIVELRLYQSALVNHSSTQYYQIVEQITVEGPDEAGAIAPLVAAGVAERYSFYRPLPLKQLHRFTDNTPATGIWFYLLGQRMHGVNAIAYGQIVHYNPSTSDLSSILSWTSPTGKIPRWQQVTNNGFPELVVDQTVGLEPHLHVYQIKPIQFDHRAIELEEISLLKPALDHSTYQDAILLSQNGLWSPAWQWLQTIKRQQRTSWTPLAQAQMDLIRLHAQFTRNQAEQTWASPSQQVLAHLVDGRWGSALQIFQASLYNTQEVASLLEADQGQLWNRVEAALRVNPHRPEVQAWGAMILAAQSGKEQAVIWLQQQPQSKTSFQYINNLLKRLESEQIIRDS